MRVRESQITNERMTADTGVATTPKLKPVHWETGNGPRCQKESNKEREVPTKDKNGKTKVKMSLVFFCCAVLYHVNVPHFP